MFLIIDRERRSVVKDEISAVEQEVHFDYEARDIIDGEHFSVISWRKSNALYGQDDFISVDPESGSIALFQGYAWKSKSVGPALNAKSICQLLIKHDYNVQATRDSINGEYAFVLIQREKLFAFNDRLGIENIYIDIAADHVFITNRMSLYGVYSKSNYDFSGLLYVPVLGFRFAEKTLYKGLSVLPQGGYLDTIDGAITLCNDPFFFLHKNPDKNLLLTGLEEAIAYLENIFFDTEQVKLGITGGMDSRLVLALLLNSNIKDKVSLFTNGFPESPDVIVGKRIAKELKLSHSNNVPEQSVNKTLDSQKIIKNIAMHAYQNEGMFGAWDIKAYPKAGSSMVLTGMVGELLKGYCKSPYDYQTTPNAADFIPKQGLLDPLNLLNKKAKHQVDSELQARVEFYLSSGCEYNDVPDIFYLKERIPNWLGAARRIDSYSDQGINPLNNTKLIQYSFSLTAEQRQSCLVHYRSLTELCQPLLKIPFADQKWNPSLEKYGAEKSVFNEPIVAKNTSKTHKPWQFTINNNDELKARVVGLLRYVDSPLRNYLLYKKLISVVETKSMSVKELVSVYGYLTVFFKSADFIVPQRLALPDKSTISIQVEPLNVTNKFTALDGGEALAKKYVPNRSSKKTPIEPVKFAYKTLLTIKYYVGKGVRKSRHLTLAWEYFKSKLNL